MSNDYTEKHIKKSKNDDNNVPYCYRDKKYDYDYCCKHKKHKKHDKCCNECKKDNIGNPVVNAHDIGNPVVNVNVNSCCNHKKNKKKRNHDDCYKHKEHNHDDCCKHKEHNHDDCCKHKEHNHDDCCKHKEHNHDDCCKHKEIEKQVNNSADDVANFPGITQSETSLAYFKNHILYGYNDFNTANNNNISGFSFSNDLGKSWTDGGTIPLNPGGVNAGDPVIAVDKKGIFYYGQIGTENIPNSIRQDVISVSTGTFSPEGVITMRPPQVVGLGQNPLPPNNALQDKEWITVGADRNSPGNEALYVVWRDRGNNDSIRFSKYRTGQNLTQLIASKTIVPGVPNTSGAFIVVDSIGDIYVFYERRPDFGVINVPNRSIRMTKSTDGGNTFPIDVQVSPLFAAAATNTTICNRPSIGVDNTRRIRMNEFPQAAIGPDGTIYVVWNAGTIVGGTTFINVYLAYSQDQGKSWNQVNITNNSSFHFFPSVAANCEGAHIQYNRFNDPNGVGGVGDGTFGIFMRTFSLSNGVSKELIVSNPSSPVPITHPNPEPNIADCYMGDYNQIILGPGSCLLHSWSDNRNLLNGRVNPNVFFKITSPKKKTNYH